MRRPTSFAIAVAALMALSIGYGCGSDVADAGSIGGGGDISSPEDVAADTAEPECTDDADCTGGELGPCERAACVEGQCLTVATDEGAACDDGDPCTEGTTCNDGACEGGTRRDCDDGNPCTEDLCSQAGECKHVNATGPCDDGDPCTSGDLCVGGECQSGDRIDCDDGNPCTDDGCSEDGCVYTPNTEPCDDEDACTENDVCADRVCAGTALSCDDDDPCTIDSCDSAVGCEHAPDPACVCASDADCDDDDPCTTDICEPDTGCRHVNECACSEDADCDDGVDCTVDTCGDDNECAYDGAACPCTPGDDAPCDDGNPCTADTCNAAFACSHAPFEDGVACDDGDACTTGDACQAGVCTWQDYICPEQACDDEEDNDHDDLVDCEDPDCVGTVICGEANCANTVDDDEDGATDCADVDCAESFDCLQQCTATTVAICGQALGGSTATADDRVTYYPDCDATPRDGGEFVYLLQVPVATDITVSLQDVAAGADLSLLLLQDTCDSASCTASGGEDGPLSFTTEADASYFVVVDGLAGAGGDFTVIFDCGDAEFACGDTYDNDFDDLVDCDDPDCEDDPICAVEENCGDGVDDDDDGLTDCVDPDCTGDPDCDGPVEEDCTNGVDDDGNSLVDCFDFGACGEHPACAVLCEAPQIADCDQVVSGSTAGAGDTITWYPFCTQDPLDGGERVYVVTPPVNAILRARLLGADTGRDVLVMGPDGCDAYTCIRHGATEVQHEMTGERQYYVVVDSAAGDEGDFELAIQCGLMELFCDDNQDDDGDGDTDCADSDCADAPGCAETICDDHLDNEGDDLTDCADPDCWDSPACTCTPTDTIACDAVVSSTTADQSDQMARYPCGPFLIANAPERIFTFTADRTDTVTASLDVGDGYPLDLFLLEGGCGPQNCAAYGDTAITFDIVEGETYHIVVDASEGFTAPFQLALDCGGAPEVACGDGADDDGDGLVDCADPDCDGSASCRSACDATGVPIRCGQTLSMTNQGRPDFLSDYTCEGWPETGGEVVFRFVAPVDDQITAAVTAQGDQDLDVMLLQGDCAPDACLDAAADTLVTNVYGGQLYYLVVDGYFPGDVGPFDLSVDCLLTGDDGETVCGDAQDDDADGATDCDDADCDWYFSCAGETCLADGFLTCGGSVSGHTGTSRNAVVSYGCDVGLFLGNETAYRFVAPQDGDVTITLSDAVADAQLFVLEDACGGDRCVATGLTSATFSAERGRSYYVVVDSLFGGATGFTLGTTCP